MRIEKKWVYLSDVHEFILNYNLCKLEYWSIQKEAIYQLGFLVICRTVSKNL